MCIAPLRYLYYTIPKLKRELKHLGLVIGDDVDYTIPKLKRELKLCGLSCAPNNDYTIPKLKRELKRAAGGGEKK